jgi:hypothetical protein
MTQTTPTASPARFEVALSNGLSVRCPAYPHDCDWLSVHEPGLETYRTTSATIEANPDVMLTRLADALCPGRLPQEGLPASPVGGETLDYGSESAITAADSGRTLRFASAPGSVDYLRVCDPDGREIAYWVSDEFAENETSALLGALASNSPLVAVESTGRRFARLVAARPDLAAAALELVDAEACTEADGKHFPYQDAGGSEEDERIAQRIGELAQRAHPAPVPVGVKRGERRVIVAEFLTDEQFTGGEDLAELAQAAVDGGLSMLILDDRTEPLDGPTLAECAIAQGSSPAFFGLQDSGQPLP